MQVESLSRVCAEWGLHPADRSCIASEDGLAARGGMHAAVDDVAAQLGEGGEWFRALLALARRYS